MSQPTKPVGDRWTTGLIMIDANKTSHRYVLNELDRPAIVFSLSQVAGAWCRFPGLHW